MINDYALDYVKIICNYEGNNVMFACQIDNWKKHKMTRHILGYHFIIMHISPGIHEFKFIVDGEWCHEDAIATTLNCFGSKNNIINFPADLEKNSNFFRYVKYRELF